MNIALINKQKNLLYLNKNYNIKNILIYTNNDLFNIYYNNSDKPFNWHESAYFAKKIIINIVDNPEIIILNSVIFIKDKLKEILILEKI